MKIMKNSNCMRLICIVIVTVIKTSTCMKQSDHYHTKYTDECDQLCEPDLLPQMEYFERNTCERGCRFFRIAAYLHQHNASSSCYSSCDRAYRKRQNEICKIGCEVMFKNRRLLKSAFSDDIMLVISDSTDTNLFRDPNVVSALNSISGYKYKMPEVQVKTMPIVTVKTLPAGDWLDCASRNSGIPRWVLLTAILAAVLVALFLSFSAERRDDSSATAENEKIDRQYLVKSDKKYPEKEESNEVAFSEPKLCTLGNVKV